MSQNAFTAVEVCEKIYKTAKEFGGFLGRKPVAPLTGDDGLVIVKTFMEFERPITGKLYPFMNMSVDEAGVIFLGNNEAACPSKKAIAIGNIQNVFEFIFEKQTTFLLKVYC